MSTATENVDYNEIEKFAELASRWWDPTSEFRPLHEMNPLRLDYIDQRAQLNNKSVLDIGCGGGILAESMAERGGKVTGIDLGEAPLAVARLHLKESGNSVNYKKISAESLAAEQPASFDIVTCMEMLEHVPDPASIVRACSQLVKPDGHVFFSTINRNPKAWLMAIVGAEYVLQLLPRGTHEYKKFIKPSELARWSRQSTLVLRDTTGMHYNPLTRQFCLSPNIDVNYILHCTRSHD